MVLAFISLRVASRVPHRIGFLHCITELTEEGEKEGTKQSMRRGGKRAKREREQWEDRRRANVWKWKRERYGTVKTEGGGGNGMLLAMLMSHYSTAEFVKWPDNSHLRPYASAFTHKDSHAARLMLPCLCYHCACVCSCSCVQVCVLLCLHSSLSGLLTVCVCACELM